MKTEETFKCDRCGKERTFPPASERIPKNEGMNELFCRRANIRLGVFDLCDNCWIEFERFIRKEVKG